MLDFITRMFVVVDVDHILRVFHVAVRRLEKLIALKAERIDRNEVLRNKVADEITHEYIQQQRATKIIGNLRKLLED